MAFEITGKVIEVLPVTQVSATFKKREFVVEKKETGGTALFIDYIKFQLIQDKCDLVSDSFINEEVKVSFNLRGNKWERDGKVSYFTNLDAWRVEKMSQSSGSDSTPPPPSVDDIPAEFDDIGDLPF